MAEDREEKIKPFRQRNLVAVEYCIGQNGEGSPALFAPVPSYAIRCVAKFSYLRGSTTTALIYIK